MMVWQHNKTPWQRFSSQPHQLFFVSSIITALSIMFLTLLSLMGYLSLNFSLLHGWGMIYGVFTNAFLGFLLTVLPRYLTLTPFKRQHILSMWISLEVGIIAILCNITILGIILYSFGLFLASYSFINGWRTSKYGDKNVSGFLIGLFIIGTLGHLLFLFLPYSSLTLALFWCYLIPLIMTIASKMIPAFFNVFLGKPSIQPSFLYLSFLIGLFEILGISTYFSVIPLQYTTASILAIFIAFHLKQWDIWYKVPSILWVLSLALVWLPIGLVLYAIELFMALPSLQLGIHTVALGFALTMLIGFGTRVILGHSEQKIIADKLTTALFVMTQFIVLSRIIASYLFIKEAFFIPFLHFSAILWILLFIVWSYRYGKTLLGIIKR